MLRKLLLVITLFFATSVFAYENCIITTNGKLTDISIEDNSIVDIYPLITVMNEKNTLFIQPLKTGNTRVCLLKNNKEKIFFNVLVKPEETIITEMKDFDIFVLDKPPGVFELDFPPMKLGNLEVE